MGFIQELLTKKVEETEVVNDELVARFDQVRSAPTKKIVRLIYKSCCGCGCSDITITREVDSDSDLKDGDRTSKLLDTDNLE